MKFSKEWSETLLKLVHGLNNFDYDEALQNQGHGELYIAGQKVGILAPRVLKELEHFPDYFKTEEVNGKLRCTLSDSLSTEEERSIAFHKVLTQWRENDKFFPLKGWRNETYAVHYRLSEPALCHIERSGCSLFGVNQYGTHINGYTFKNGELIMWIGRRSKTKPTFPNMLDNMCAGGLASGLGITECAIKESQEEASISDEILKNMKPVGSISYCYVDERGINAETQYVFDVELPPDFEPKNADGEMQNFYAYNLEQIQDAIIQGEFKPNCAAVVLDFMIRRGYVTPDNEPNYLYLNERIHRGLQPAY